MGQGRNKRRRIIGKAKLRSQILQGCDVVLTTLSESKPFIYSSLEKLTLLHFLLFLTISSKYYFISPGGAGSKAFSKHKQGCLLFLAHHSPDINLTLFLSFASLKLTLFIEAVLLRMLSSTTVSALIFFVSLQQHLNLTVYTLCCSHYRRGLPSY